MRAFQALAISAVAALLASASPTLADPPRVVFECRSYTTQLGGTAALTLEKAFFEDGSVYRQKVTWEDRTGSFISPQQRGATAMATLSWPGDEFERGERPFSWSDGYLQASVFSSPLNRPDKHERWRQILIDRGGGTRIFEEKEERYLSRVPGVPILETALEGTSTFGLRMSLDDLLAWSTGRKVIVYETYVTPRPYRSGVFPSSPVGEARIAADYVIDSAQLATTVERIKATAEAWERSLRGFRDTCTRTTEMRLGDIVVN